MNTNWNVTWVPDGTRDEAEAAAQQARGLLARWILRDARGEQNECGPAPEG